MANYETLEFQIDNAVATITLNRPAAANAFNLQLGTELNQVASLCDGNPDIRAVVLTANGKLFCAGGDLGCMAEAGDGVDIALKALTAQCHAAYSTLMRMNQPLIVAVNGAAAGIGMSLALLGDITIASEKAAFSMAYTAAGLSPDGGSTFLLPKVVGLKRAKELMITNRRLSAAEALDWGIVSQVVAADDLQATAQALAAQLAQGATQAFGVVKALALSGCSESFESQMVLEARGIAACAKGVDGSEGISAFLEKRRAEFKGQ